MRVYVNDLTTGELVARELETHEYPSQITVFCDRCGDEVTGDYVVSEHMTSPERLEVARAHLRGEGWVCDKTGDYCPDCKTKVGHRG
ncbi:hypothetical protein ACQP25_44955 (plasmid) [Microtetraspora malaysiensis]|uniref:hypothetical protein n=1 Tax=Microtetraspora malaysiensis TaxID=161358 RepID=UPI003D93C526